MGPKIWFVLKSMTSLSPNGKDLSSLLLAHGTVPDIFQRSADRFTPGPSGHASVHSGPQLADPVNP